MMVAYGDVCTEKRSQCFSLFFPGNCLRSIPFEVSAYIITLQLVQERLAGYLQTTGCLAPIAARFL